MIKNQIFASFQNLTNLFNLSNLYVCLDKLYWISDAKPPQNIHNAFFFNIDNVSRF